MTEFSTLSKFTSLVEPLGGVQLHYGSRTPSTGITGFVGITPPPWHVDAECRTNPEPGADFFPTRADGIGASLAKVTCARCPIKQTCLEYALERREIGIWGGTSGKMRRQMRSGPRVQAAILAVCGTDAGYQRHRRLQETVCDECRAAHATYNALNRDMTA